MPNLKQGTLSFASAKRTSSALSGKSQKRVLGTDKEKDKRVVVPEEAPYDAEFSEILEISSDEDSTPGDIIIPAKRPQPSTKTHASPSVKKASSELPRSKRQKPSPGVVEGEHLDINDKTDRYRKYYSEVRSKMGYMEPIHSEGQNRIHQMLRFFDMSYEFGPCIGMTRLERWERAQAFSLNPPVEVRDILLTREGTERVEYAHCVLHGEV